MNWYRIKTSQYFSDSQDMEYLDIGHQGWGSPTTSQPFRKNITKECVWEVDSNWQIHEGCNNDSSRISHDTDLPSGYVSKGRIAGGRYVEYSDKEPILSLSTVLSEYDPGGQAKLKKLTNMLDEYYNYPIMYNL